MTLRDVNTAYYFPSSKSSEMFDSRYIGVHIFTLLSKEIKPRYSNENGPIFSTAPPSPGAQVRQEVSACPASHKYAFDSGTRCCQYSREDGDRGNGCGYNRIEGRSRCCFDNRVAACPRPPCVDHFSEFVWIFTFVLGIAIESMEKEGMAHCVLSNCANPVLQASACVIALLKRLPILLCHVLHPCMFCC